MEIKKSKLIFDPKLGRRLLKMNGEPKFCPYCGEELVKNCECHKNIIIDIKPKRGSENESIMVFMNNEAFQKDVTDILENIYGKESVESESPEFED